MLLFNSSKIRKQWVGPGPRFELGRKAPQASMLPSYTTPAALVWFFAWSVRVVWFVLIFVFGTLKHKQQDDADYESKRDSYVRVVAA